jgi:hypothetical protein
MGIKCLAERTNVQRFAQWRQEFTQTGESEQWTVGGEQMRLEE